MQPPLKPHHFCLPHQIPFVQHDWHTLGSKPGCPASYFVLLYQCTRCTYTLLTFKIQQKINSHVQKFWIDYFVLFAQKVETIPCYSSNISFGREAQQMDLGALNLKSVFKSPRMCARFWNIAPMWFVPVAWWVSISGHFSHHFYAAEVDLRSLLVCVMQWCCV